MVLPTKQGARIMLTEALMPESMYEQKRKVYKLCGKLNILPVYNESQVYENNMVNPFEFDVLKTVGKIARLIETELEDGYDGP